MSWFYITTAPYVCAVHLDEPAVWEVRGQSGEVYRRACKKSCAERQRDELEAGPFHVGDPS